MTIIQEIFSEIINMQYPVKSCPDLENLFLNHQKVLKVSLQLFCFRNLLKIIKCYMTTTAEEMTRQTVENPSFRETFF